MEQNNNIQSDSRVDGMNDTDKQTMPQKEYTLPQNKEQFKQVLEQAQQGMYQQQYKEPPRQNDQILPERRNAYELKSTDKQQAAEPDRESFLDNRKPVYVNRYAGAKKKRKFNPLVIIIPVAVLLIAAAAVFFIFFNNTLSYRKAEENYFGGIYKSLLSRVENAEEKSKSISSSQLKADIISPLGSMFSITDTDLSSVSLLLNMSVQGEDVYNALDIALGSISESAEVWIDREKGSALVFLPGISDIYAYIEASAEEAAMPSEYIKACCEVLCKTSERYFEFVGEPEITENQEFTINETVYTADKYTVHLDGIQTAIIEKALIENLLENEKTSGILCKQMEYDSKEELLADEKISGELDRLNNIINGEQSDYPSFDMTVYVKNNAIIGREAVIAFSAPDETEETDLRAYFNLFEIPTDKGSYTQLYYKYGSAELTVICEDETSGADNSIHDGKLSVSCGDNAYTASYSDFALMDDLFQGKAVISSEKDPALTASVELKTENGTKQFTLSIPNIVTAAIELTPSDIPFKETPALSDGEYADFSDYTHDEQYSASEAGAAAVEKFISDVNEYVFKLLGLDNFIENDKDKTETEANPSDTENNVSDNSDDGTVPPDGNTNDDETASETSDAENTAPVTSEAPVSENTSQNVPEITPETSVTESSPPVTSAPASNGGSANSSGSQAPSVSASTLDVGGSQKISNAQLDSFNSGNYYRTEIYVDGASNASSNINISEISGTFDSYIKGKALQIGFADGYSFDSALVVLTIPSGTVTSGRHYPNSSVLSGLNRYRLMGMSDSDVYESEITFYRYSGNQIGFIVENPGYYYLIDMDEYYYSVLGTNPDDLEVHYAE